VCYAVHRGLLREEQVCDVVRRAPPGSCIVLTGRGATEGLIRLADTVTDMHCVKHAHQEGSEGQRGVEK
jgi:cob(I)alamin adenosyltransferase